MDALAHPFRFVDGRARVVDTESDAFAAQRIAALLQTHYRELPILPSFGCTDPEFSRFSGGELLQGVSNFFPDVIIDDISEQVRPDGRLDISISFHRRS